MDVEIRFIDSNKVISLSCNILQNSNKSKVNVRQDGSVPSYADIIIQGNIPNQF